MKIKQLSNGKFAVVTWSLLGGMCVNKTTRLGMFELDYQAYPESGQFETWEEAKKVLLEYRSQHMR